MNDCPYGALSSYCPDPIQIHFLVSAGRRAFPAAGLAQSARVVCRNISQGHLLCLPLL